MGHHSVAWMLMTQEVKLLGSGDPALVRFLTQLLEFVLYFYTRLMNAVPFTEQMLRLGQALCRSGNLARVSPSRDKFYGFFVARVGWNCQQFPDLVNFPCAELSRRGVFRLEILTPGHDYVP
jgi:hypothetical protein